MNEKIVGINFEGGKIVSHMSKSPACVAYANIQIGMDAPYDEQIATEELRLKGRSETQFPGYNEIQMIHDLKMIFEYIMKNYPCNLIIQIARGKSAVETESSILVPLLESLSITNYVIRHGYKNNTFMIDFPADQFVFVNIGMFARLTHTKIVLPGTICNPVETIDILSISNTKFIFSPQLRIHSTDKKNILNKFGCYFKPLKLYGIADNMSFITPTEYPMELISSLL